MLRYLQYPGTAAAGGLTEDDLRALRIAVGIANATPSTDSTTGALVVTGGVGIGGNLNVDNSVNADSISILSGTVATDFTIGGNLNTSSITNTGTIVSTSGYISFLTADNLSGTTGILYDLSVTNTADINDLSANIAYVEELTGNVVGAQSINATSGSFVDLLVDNLLPRTGSQINFGDVGNIRIAGGSLGQVLTTDGNGNLTWQEGPAGLNYINGIFKDGTNISLTETGVTPGTYNSVTVDEFGRIVDATVVASTLDTLAQQDANISAVLYVTNTTDSIDTETGALVVSGGAGIGGTLVAGEIISVDGITAGGVFLANSTAVFNDTAVFSGQSTSSAALVISSGSLRTSPVIGGIEFDGTSLYVTTTAGRQRLQIQQPGLTSSNTTGVKAAATVSVDIVNPTQYVGETNPYDDVILSFADRILLANQADPAQNGIYVWNGENQPLTRSSDFNSISGIFSGTVIFVSQGQLYSGSLWQISTAGTITVGSTAITIDELYNRDAQAISNLPKDFSSGLVARSQFGTMALRSIISGNTWIRVANGDGRDGNITITATTIPVSAGGTGRTSIFGYMRGIGSSILGYSVIPYTDISGLGTIVTQNSNSVNITGGNISGLGNLSATTVSGTTGSFSGNLTAGNIDVSGQAEIEKLTANTFNLTTGTIDSLTVNELKGNAFVGQGTDPSNWDTNTGLGMYFVNRSDWSATIGTPSDAYSKGMLMVLVVDGMVVQKYQPNDSISLVGSEWYRSKYPGGNWTLWARHIGDNGRLDGGSF